MSPPGPHTDAGEPVPPDGERTWRPGWPIQVGAIVAVLRRGGGDPTSRADRGEGWWFGLPTPQGPVALQVLERASLGEVGLRAWGPGTTWALDQAPALLGASDDPAGFEPRHPQVREALRRYAGWRVPRTGLVLHALVPAVIEQKVTGQEAFGGYRTLVHRFGERAPGEGGRRGLWVAPTAQQWSRIPSWDWLRASVDGARSKTAVRAAGHAGRLEEVVAMPWDRASARLQAVPGVGVWTAAEVAQRALGDPDSPSFGDYHVAKNIGWVLTGTPVDDDGMAELLEPYAGHRYRVQRLLELNGGMRPRRGPRMSPRTHLPR